jgi:hypothetical protein
MFDYTRAWYSEERTNDMPFVVRVASFSAVLDQLCNTAHPHAQPRLDGDAVLRDVAGIDDLLEPRSQAEHLKMSGRVGKRTVRR